LLTWRRFFYGKNGCNHGGGDLNGGDGDSVVVVVLVMMVVECYIQIVWTVYK
jgi:hypothetical protein